SSCNPNHTPHTKRGRKKTRCIYGYAYIRVQPVPNPIPPPSEYAKHQTDYNNGRIPARYIRLADKCRRNARATHPQCVSGLDAKARWLVWPNSPGDRMRNCVHWYLESKIVITSGKNISQ